LTTLKRKQDWLRNRNTVEYLGIWESVYNPNFNYGEFAIIKSKAGLKLNKVAITQMKSLIENKSIKKLN
jgi:hypothetical protein